MKLDLSKLKKISSDKQSTTFQHPDGHAVKIAHGKLQPKLRDELDKIPVYKAAGGMVNKYAEGTPDEPVANDTQVQPQGPVVINVGAQPQQPPSPPVAQNPQPVPQPQVAAPTPTPVPAPVPNEQASTPPQESALSGQEGIAPKEPEIINANDQPHDEQPQQAQPASAPATEQPLQTPQQQYQQHKAMALQEYTSEDQAFQNDLNNGHITPKTYGDLFANKSTLGKIGMIFGMMSSGAGSGLSHQPNALLTMMNNEIQNDLAAQQQSKANAQNLIRLNQAHHMNEAQVGLTGAQANLTEAEAKMKVTTLSNMQANRLALDSISAQVKRLPDGSPDRMKAEQALAMMYNSVNNENFNIASRAASASAYYKMLMGQSGGSGGGGEQAFQQKTTGMRMLGPQGSEMAKNMEEKHFPGLKGQASVPLSGEDRNSINSGMDFDQKLHRFIDWTQNHSGDLNPSDKNTGQALAAELQGAYRQATHGGVYKEGEQNFISKLIDQTPTKFFNEIRVIPQLKAIAGENKARVNQLVQSKGFDGYSGPSNTSPQKAQGPEVKTMGGVQYQKVNGGWQRTK